MPKFLKAEVAIITRLKEELSSNLIYHSYFHTLDVLNAAMQIAEKEKITQEELSLLRVAIAYHDSGFIEVYKGHELKSCEYARNELPFFEFTDDQIEIICGIIMATKIPQQTNTKLQEIIADADLDYLGRKDYSHIASKLFAELKLQGIIKDSASWIEMQENFLTTHQYKTNFSKEFREPVKQNNLSVMSSIGLTY